MLSQHVAHNMCLSSTQSHGSRLTAQDYVGDGEHGGRRSLLNMMINQDVQNKVIFITRHFGGENLQGRRFQLIDQAGRIALESTNVAKIICEAESRKKACQKRQSRRRIVNMRGRGRGGRIIRQGRFPGSSPCPPFHTGMEENSASFTAPLSLPREARVEDLSEELLKN